MKLTREVIPAHIYILDLRGYAIILIIAAVIILTAGMFAAIIPPDWRVNT
jgi:hypothetical protein